MTNATKHLTDEQFAECLSGEPPSRETQSHLATCDACRGEVEIFYGAVGDFSEAALDWSKSQPSVSPRAVASRPSMAAPLRWALAAVLLLAVGVPAALHREHAETESAPGDSPAQIAQDNTLLQSVDVALADSDPSPFREYGIADTPQKNSKSRLESRNR